MFDDTASGGKHQLEHLYCLTDLLFVKNFFIKLFLNSHISYETNTGVLILDITIIELLI